MNPVTTAWKRIAIDKRLHIVAGAIVCAVVAAAWELLALQVWAWAPHQGAVVGVAAGLLAGVAKELYDRDRQDVHTVDHRDVVATLIGAAVVGIVLRVLGLA